MARRLKALGLVLAAALALAALGASNASALGEKFHSEVKPTVLTGTNYEIGPNGEEITIDGVHTFISESFALKCSTVTVSGTWVGEEEETMTLHPTYKGCSFGGGNATVDTTGCNFIYWAEKVGKLSKVEVECEAGKEVKITTTIGCTLKIGALATPGVVYANGGAMATRDITATIAFEAKFAKEGALCGLLGPATKGTYEGGLTIKGYEDLCGAGECPFVPGGGEGDKDAYKEGKQVGIWWL